MKTLHDRSERGASAVLVGVVMLILIGFASLAVDVGSWWWDKKRLQNGADAGALAIAQACAADPDDHDLCADGWDNPLVEYLAPANADDASGVAVVDKSERRVTVDTVRTRQGLFFSGTAEIRATATAVWSGHPSSLTTFPFAVSYCQFFWQNFDAGQSPADAYSGFPEPGTPVQIFSKTNWKDFPLPPDADPSTHPCLDTAAHNEAGGGFGFLKAEAGCVAHTAAGGEVAQSDGEGMDTPTCSIEDVHRMLGTDPDNPKVVPVPLFDKTNNQNGNKARYYLSGYAAIKVSAYCIQAGGWAAMPGPATKCSKNFIQGEFVGSGSLEDLGDDGDGTDYGVVSVRLTLDSES